MQRLMLSILIPALGLAVAAGCASNSPPAAGLAPWDQARAAALAAQLSAAADAWQLAVRRENDDRLGSGTAEEGFKLTEKAQIVSEQARSLAGHLKAGEGRDQTYNPFRSLKEVVDDADVDQSRSELDAPTIAAWAKVTGLIAQLKPYYEK
ncbi:MAG TPA: hypothetical protein VII72_21280 [Myxococcota bacterium]|jgi:hypothetical protein